MRYGIASAAAGNDARFTMEAFLALAGHPPCPDPAGQHAAHIAPPPPAAAAVVTAEDLEKMRGVALPEQQGVVAGWGDAPTRADPGVEAW